MPDGAAILARWLIGALFLYLGLTKAADPVGFLKLVRQYELTDSYLVLNCLAVALPWFEVFCGLLLLLGVAVRGTALSVVVMLVPFTLVVLRRAWTIHATQGMPLCAVSFDCGCGNGEVWICGKLIENCLLLLLSAWLIIGRGRQLCARFSVWAAEPSRSEV